MSAELNGKNDNTQEAKAKILSLLLSSNLHLHVNGFMGGDEILTEAGIPNEIRFLL